MSTQKRVKLYPEATDDLMFIIGAFRYGLSRSSYAVGCITAVLLRIAGALTRETRDLIAAEIDEALGKGEIVRADQQREWRSVAAAMRGLKDV